MLRVGQPGDAVEATLGVGYRVERSAGKTSGIFTVGSVPRGTEHYYRNDNSRFAIFVNREGRISLIQAQSFERAEWTRPGVLTSATEPTVLERLTDWFLKL